MLWVKLPVVDRVQPQSNKFAMGVENEASGDSDNLYVIIYFIILFLSRLGLFIYLTLANGYNS